MSEQVNVVGAIEGRATQNQAHELDVVWSGDGAVSPAGPFELDDAGAGLLQVEVVNAADIGTVTVEGIRLDGEGVRRGFSASVAVNGAGNYPIPVTSAVRVNSFTFAHTTPKTPNLGVLSLRDTLVFPTAATVSVMQIRDGAARAAAWTAGAARDLYIREVSCGMTDWRGDAAALVTVQWFARPFSGTWLPLGPLLGVSPGDSRATARIDSALPIDWEVKAGYKCSVASTLSVYASLTGTSTIRA